MASTPVALIDATGIHVPAFAEELAYFTDGMRGIYGADLPLDNSEMDTQWLGLLATALHDVNSGLVAAYNAYSPGTAVGVGLSSLVKLNGIARHTPSYSQADVTLIGQAGTVTGEVVVNDSAGNGWFVQSVTIPASGSIVATATCNALGTITAAPGDISNIQTVTRGLQAAFNVNAATPGAPVEGDAPLRRRQELSTAVPARGTSEAARGAILAIAGVTACRVYENDDDVTDSKGQPPHSLAFIVDGGDAQAVGDMIRRKKGGGVSTFGTTRVTSYDRAGLPHVVAFFRSITTPITVYLAVTPLQGYNSDVQDTIRTTVAAWINGLDEGQDIVRSRVAMPANLFGQFPSNTFRLDDIRLARDGQGASASDVAIGFNERATCTPDSVQFYVPNS